MPGFSLTYSDVDFLATSPFTLGYAFKTTTALRVSQLGIFDYLGDGLVDSHDVGLFDTQGQLLASAVIASGTGASLNGYFRYASIAPVTLASDQTYFLGALYASNGDEYVSSPTSIKASSGLSYQYGSYGYDPDGNAVLSAPLTLAQDRFDGTPISYFGPNLIVTAVPLPASLALFGLGLLAFGGLGCVSRRVARGGQATSISARAG